LAARPRLRVVRRGIGQRTVASVAWPW